MGVFTEARRGEVDVLRFVRAQPGVLRRGDEFVFLVVFGPGLRRGDRRVLP